MRRARDWACYWLVVTVIRPTSVLGMWLLPWAGNHAYRQESAPWQWGYIVRNVEHGEEYHHWPRLAAGNAIEVRQRRRDHIADIIAGIIIGLPIGMWLIWWLR